jgi:hypothetical protein
VSLSVNSLDTGHGLFAFLLFHMHQGGTITESTRIIVSTCISFSCISYNINHTRDSAHRSIDQIEKGSGSHPSKFKSHDHKN